MARFSKLAATSTLFVNKHLTILIFVVMVFGLLNSYLFGGIPFNLVICATASFLMIYPMFINLKVEDIAEIKNHKSAVLLSLLINFILSPLFAFTLSKIFLLLGSGTNSSMVVFLIALAFFVQVPFSSLYAKLRVRFSVPATSLQKTIA